MPWGSAILGGKRQKRLWSEGECAQLSQSSDAKVNLHTVLEAPCLMTHWKDSQDSVQRCSQQRFVYYSDNKQINLLGTSFQDPSPGGVV